MTIKYAEAASCFTHACMYSHWPVLLTKPHILFFFERLVAPQQLLGIQPLRTPLHIAQGLTYNTLHYMPDLGDVCCEASAANPVPIKANYDFE